MTDQERLDRIESVLVGLISWIERHVPRTDKATDELGQILDALLKDGPPVARILFDEGKEP